MTARDGKKRESGFTRRLVLAATIQGAALAALGYRLYSLQVPRQDDFLADSFDIRTVTRYDAPTRGIILDRFGRQLAGNEQSYNLMFYPERKAKRIETNDTAIVRRAAALIQASPFLTERMIEQLDIGQDVIAGEGRLLSEITAEDFDLIAEVGPGRWPGFGAIERFGRYGLTYKVVSSRAKDEARAIEEIFSILPLSPEQKRTINRRIVEAKQINAEGGVLLAEDLSWGQVAQLKARALDLPGAEIDVAEKRFYHYPGTAAHALGYVSQVQPQDLIGDEDRMLRRPNAKIGRKGIERTMEKSLRGRAGRRIMEINAFGQEQRVVSRVPPIPGRVIRSTIDLGLQTYAEQRLAEQPISETEMIRAGAAVVMKVDTGEVLAMASHPTFDQSIFTSRISNTVWNELINDEHKPLVNKSAAEHYPPGSTYKMVTMLAALESGIDPREQVTCAGKTQVGPQTFYCWKRDGHGRVGMESALVQSCDTWYYEMSQRIGPEKMSEVAARLGFGDRLMIDVAGETRGVVPNENWKRNSLGQSWFDGDTVQASIGQGYVLTTPLQLATMTARIANGGRAVRPHLIVPDLPYPAEDLGFKPEHLEIVRRAMNRVTNTDEGTAYRYTQVEEPALQIAGKTGTAQVARLSVGERLRMLNDVRSLDYNRRNHALFVGYGPLKRPRYACAVIIEHGDSGGRSAGPVVLDLLQAAIVGNSGGQPNMVNDRYNLVGRNDEA